MTTQSSKVIISYSGGSAGDMFTLSCNGEPLTTLTGIRVSQPATLKDYEHKVKMGENPILKDELNKMPYQYVNTHMLNEIVGMGIPVYNVVISDKEVQLKTVYRQMQLQRLGIQVDNNEKSWYYTIKQYCDDKDFGSAAKFWLDKAMVHWLNGMEYRLNFTNANLLNFNRIYLKDFADDIESQGWNQNIELLKSNHAKWLEKNKDFSYEKTLDVMKQKIASMNWDKREGWIFYNPL